MGKAWLYRKKITVNRARESDQDLIDFPLLIVVKAVALRSVVHGGHVDHENGADLYFADPGGTRLDHALEHYDPATGVLGGKTPTRRIRVRTHPTAKCSVTIPPIRTHPLSSNTRSVDTTGAWALLCQDRLSPSTPPTVC